MEIDDSTGLPKVPKRYFWRVRESYYGTTVYVELRKKHIIGSTEVRYASMYAWKLSPAEVLSAATAVYRDCFPSPPENAHLLGDYPPKKLGNN